MEIEKEYQQNTIKSLRFIVLGLVILLFLSMTYFNSLFIEQKSINKTLIESCLKSLNNSKKSLKESKEAKNRSIKIMRNFYGKNGYAMVSKFDWDKHPEWQKHIEKEHTSYGKGCLRSNN